MGLETGFVFLLDDEILTCPPSFLPDGRQVSGAGGNKFTCLPAGNDIGVLHKKSACKKGDEERINAKCTIGNVQLSMKNGQCVSARVFQFLKEIAKRQRSGYLGMWG